MAAPQGNKFWKQRSTHGRPKIFATPEIMWQAACEYFEWCDNNPFLQAEQSRQQSKSNSVIGQEGIAPNSSIVELPRMRPYTLQGLCIYIDANTKYFNDFADGLKGKDDEIAKGFSEIITRIRDVVYNQKFSGAASGFFNANIIARDLGLKDSSDVTSKGEQIKNEPSVIKVFTGEAPPLAGSETEIETKKED